LDRYKGELTSKDSVDVLNAVLPDEPFIYIGDKLAERWEEARDYFKEQLEQGKVQFARDMKVIKEFTDIRYSTAWEDYPAGVRVVIGQVFAIKLGITGKSVSTTPPSFSVPKYKIFEMAMEYSMGKSSEYLKHNKKIKDETKD
jgi:hypothetical protein